MANPKKLAKLAGLVSVNIAGAVVLVTAWGAHNYTKRDNRLPSNLKKIDDIPIADIEVETPDGINISAWLLKKSRKKIVILLSGRGSNRSKNIIKARAYLAMGYSVIMPDLRGTGRSGGKRISFGWKERKDLLELYFLLRKKGYTEIGVHGYSLGAATIVYSLLHIRKYHFVVLESCYANFVKAVEGAFLKYHVPNVLTHGILPMAEYLIGATRINLQPKNLIHLCKVPMLFMAGDKELIVKKQATLALFKRNQARFSKIHFFKGAQHANFSEKYPEEFKQVLTDFVEMVDEVTVPQQAKAAV